MAKFDKFQVMAKIAEAPMVPVFYNKDVEVAKNVVKACYEGGVRAFEFTNRGDFAQEVFAELSKFVSTTWQATWPNGPTRPMTPTHITSLGT